MINVSLFIYNFHKLIKQLQTIGVNRCEDPVALNKVVLPRLVAWWMVGVTPNQVTPCQKKTVISGYLDSRRVLTAWLDWFSVLMPHVQIGWGLGANIPSLLQDMYLPCPSILPCSASTGNSTDNILNTQSAGGPLLAVLFRIQLFTPSHDQQVSSATYRSKSAIVVSEKTCILGERLFCLTFLVIWSYHLLLTPTHHELPRINSTASGQSPCASLAESTVQKWIALLSTPQPLNPQELWITWGNNSQPSNGAYM